MFKGTSYTCNRHTYLIIYYITVNVSLTNFYSQNVYYTLQSNLSCKFQLGLNISTVPWLSKFMTPFKAK